MVKVDKAIELLDELVKRYELNPNSPWSPRKYYQDLRLILLALKEDDNGQN